MLHEPLLCASDAAHLACAMKVKVTGGLRVVAGSIAKCNATRYNQP
jgi:hypothetical protein